VQVKDFMTRRVVTITPDTTLLAAAKLMLEHRVGGLPVLDAAGRIIGVFSESDLLRKLFETVVARCMKEGIVGGEAFAVDVSHDCCRCASKAWGRQGPGPRSDLKPRGRRISFCSR